MGVCARRRDRRLLVAVAAVTVSLIASGCSCGTESATQRPYRATGKATTVEVSPAESFSVEVPAVSVAGGPGTVAESGKVTVTPVKLRSPPAAVADVPVDSVALGVLVEFRSTRIAAPVNVVFNDVPVDTAAVAVHISGDGEWTPLESTRSGTTLTVETDEFSVISWVSTKLFDPVISYVEEQLTGRSSPVACENPPAWTSVTAPPSGTLHACVRGAPDGSGAAELDLKSNRGSFQIVDIPPGPPRRYVWVEDQPDPLRALAKTFTGNDNQVVLPPQKRMTIGYDQPTVQYPVPFNSEVTQSTVLLSAAGWAIDYLVGKTNFASQLGPLYCAHVLQFDLRGATGTIDGVKVSGPSLSRQLWECAVDYLDTLQKHPEEVLTQVQQVTGQSFSPDDATRLTTKVDKIAGTASKILAVLTVGGVAFQTWSMVFDQVVAAVSPDNISAATLALDASARECNAPNLLAAAQRHLAATGGSGAVTKVSDLRCRERAAFACAVNSITGDTDCTTYFTFDGSRWNALDANWDACADDLQQSGMSKDDATALAAHCSPEGTTGIDDPAGGTPANPIVPDSIEAFLGGLVDAWRTGNKGELSRYGSAAVLRPLTELSPADDTVEVGWDPAACEIGTSGTGGCQLIVTDRTLGAMVGMAISYGEIDARGAVIITEIRYTGEM